MKVYLNSEYEKKKSLRRLKALCDNYRQANEETGSFLKTFRGSLELTYLILILSSKETSESEIAMG